MVRHLNFAIQVGWLTFPRGRYATSPDLNAYSALIQNYFTNETAPFPAVHITVDTTLTESGQGLGVKGWVSTALGLTPKPENCAFLPVPVNIKYAESERAARTSESLFNRPYTFEAGPQN
jgi:hypothetical protein